MPSTTSTARWQAIGTPAKDATDAHSANKKQTITTISATENHARNAVDAQNNKKKSIFIWLFPYLFVPLHPQIQTVP
jgi:hypothetical protein